MAFVAGQCQRSPAISAHALLSEVQRCCSGVSAIATSRSATRWSNISASSDGICSTVAPSRVGVRATPVSTSRSSGRRPYCRNGAGQRTSRIWRRRARRSYCASCRCGAGAISSHRPLDFPRQPAPAAQQAAYRLSAADACTRQVLRLRDSTVTSTCVYLEVGIRCSGKQRKAGDMRGLLRHCGDSTSTAKDRKRRSERSLTVYR